MDINRKATIFDIGHFRNEDGPGIRTIIFFKGCPLRCKWCSNPFGLSSKPQMVFNEERCSGCRECLQVCKENANYIDDFGKIAVNFDKCTVCGQCVSECFPEARKIHGKKATVGELLEIVTKDADFYRRDSGGVTLSGGEILMQYETAAELLEACSRRLIHTCIETSAYAKWEHLERVLKYTSLAFIDLKHINSEKHQQLTGVPNYLILDNIERACEYMHSKGRKVIIRRVIVPGMTDDDENTIETAKFVSQLTGCPEINLLPYHNLGEAKYKMAGMKFEASLADTPMLNNKDNRLLHIQKLTKEYAPKNYCSVGGQYISK